MNAAGSTATEPAATPATKARPGPMAPFRHRAFTLLWVATVASNIGTWMHDIGAGWLMTELAPSPVMVSAVQAATTLPIFLFALLAGAVADIVDRRRLLVWVNAAMGVAALAMALLVHGGLMTPWLLLIFTFLFGTGTAFIAPAWQAIVPKLVPRQDLSAAIALNSMGINVSRAIGPALAGFLIVAAGIAVPFVVNAVSVVGIVAALLWWRPAAPAAATLPPEGVGTAIVAGLRYAANSPALRATLVRAAAFFAFASAFWAMLPLVARDVLAGGPTLYGLMLAAVGLGAVGGALVLPRIKARLGADGTVAAGTAGTALVMVLIATVPSQAVALAGSALAGLSWIAVLSSLNVSAQTALPDWVRARGLSVFLTVFFGSMSLGSLAWGQVAAIWGLPVALIAAALGALALLPLTRGARLQQGAALDLAPSMHWPEPVLAGRTPPDGPVMVQVIYAVAEGEQAAFLARMQALAGSRRRGGGFRWSLMRDAADPERFVESWWEASWLDHQRQHQRVSRDDAALQAEIQTLQKNGQAPGVRHLVSTPPATA
ncbi:MAG: MFS transporter [Pseudomonadota bacterium]